MNKKQSRLVRVGDYVAEVQVMLETKDTGWSPLMSLEDAKRLDVVRKALFENRIEDASKLGRVYRMTPVAV